MHIFTPFADVRFTGCVINPEDGIVFGEITSVERMSSIPRAPADLHTGEMQSELGQYEECRVMTRLDRETLLSIFIDAINEIGLPAFKRMSIFGSNDPAFKAAKNKGR